MNPLSDLERLVAAIEHQGANIAPTYQEYMPIAFATAGKREGRSFIASAACPRNTSTKKRTSYTTTPSKRATGATD